jgi:hypothetical protein
VLAVRGGITRRSLSSARNSSIGRPHGPLPSEPRLVAATLVEARRDPCVPICCGHSSTLSPRAQRGEFGETVRQFPFE